MAKQERVQKVPAFGRLLAKLRHERYRDRKVELVATLIEAETGVKTSGGSLRGYEFGWNETMDPVLLSALARAYRTDIEELIAVLRANRANQGLQGLQDVDVEQILRDVRTSRHGQAQAAGRFADIGVRLLAIQAELGNYAVEAVEWNAHADGGTPRGQTATAGQPASDGSDRH